MIKIRLTEASEAQLLSEIQKQAFLPLYERYHDAGNPYLRGKEDILMRLNNSKFRYFTILEDEIVVGGVFYRTEGSGLFFETLGDGEYYLQRIYVRPDRQGKKIAQKAMLLCEKEFTDAVHIYVDFPEDLDKNRKCYESVGFRDRGERIEVEQGLTLASYEKYIG